MMELIRLKIRLLDLKQRQPVGSTPLAEGMQWMLDQAELLSDIADYTLRTQRALQR